MLTLIIRPNGNGWLLLDGKRVHTIPAKDMAEVLAYNTAHTEIPVTTHKA